MNAMMYLKNIFFTVTILFLVCSCANDAKKEKKLMTDNNLKLQQYISSIDTVTLRDNDAYQLLDFNETLNGYMTNTDDFGIVYMINAECSSCIADYLRFVRTLSIKPFDNIVLYGIANKSNIDLLEYYLEQGNNIPVLNSVIIPEDNPYPFVYIDPSTNVYVVYKGKVCGKINFSANFLTIL